MSTRELPLQGKTALITGGSRGIGHAIATHLAAAGAHIAITHTQSTLPPNTMPPLHATGRQVRAYRSNAASHEDATKLVQSVVQDFGSIDILVNNAGITHNSLLPHMAEAAWDEVMDVNLKSCFNTAKAATPFLIRQRSGSIINISSVVGLKGNAGQTNYAASKAGMIGFTKALALELGSRNIRVNAIAPGLTQTDMTAGMTAERLQAWEKAIPLGRIGLPKEIAACALFLASDAASYITGQVIQVDGGLYM